MYLKEVVVQNFRNLERLEVDLHRGLNLVVGRNNVGKSNFFRAVLHALGPASAQGDALWLRSEDRFHNGTDFGKPPIRISLSFAGLSDDDRVQYFDILDYNLNDPSLSLARIHFEAAWDESKKRFKPRRWGGPASGERTDVPQEILSSLPITFLPALRDAESALSPGRSSRLALLLERLAGLSPDGEDEASIVEIFQAANGQLSEHKLITGAEERLAANTKSMSGTDFEAPMIRAAEASFGRILRTLRILLPGCPIEDLSSSGLGYNNLLFIGTVLAHLRDSAGETPFLLIEEPEAHLHPQLVQQLGKALSGVDGAKPPQTIVTTHSPILASQVKPSQVAVLFDSGAQPRIRCNSLSKLQLEPAEERKLQRMLDITRGTMYFAKGLILVEGVSEELLIPSLARQMNVDLSENHVSVIPLSGVPFKSIAKILGENGFQIPVAMVTDGDPGVERGDTWHTDCPKIDEEGKFLVSARVKSLKESFDDHSSIRVFSSSVTLEYDLAAASRANAELMAELWEETYPNGKVLKRDMLEGMPCEKEAALTVWRGICQSQHSGSKAEFAHVMADRLSTPLAGGLPPGFSVPPFLAAAVEWACPNPAVDE